MIPPHHAMRMFLDSGPDRAEHPDLEDRYDVRVRYGDERTESWDETCKLDLGIRTGMTNLTTYGMHHAAKALRDIDKSLKSMAKSAGKVEATVESRAERDVRLAEIREHRKRLMATVEEAQARGGTQEGPLPDSSSPS
jgi:hypothetical protein